jgi:CBS domain containing-hemolysin-like protein
MVDILLTVFGVLLLSGTCSATEAAFFSVPLVRARQLAENHGGRGRAVLRIREAMGRPIATLVILNNIANIVGSILVGHVATRQLGDQWLGVFSGVMTFLVIIFGEILPKTLGERRSDGVALFTARPLLGAAVLLAPLTYLIDFVTRPFTRGKRSTTTNEAEIQFLASIGQAEGSIEADESEMIQRVFSLNDQTAAQIMTPRVTVSALWADTTLGEAREFVLQSPHSRLVVYGQTVDEVMGVVMKHDLLAALVGELHESPVSRFVRPVHRVPETIRADVLLEIFRKSRQHLAVVVNEYGGFSGVVTLEDVLEVITGEIVDETDRVVDLQEDARRKRRHLLDETGPLTDSHSSVGKVQG